MRNRKKGESNCRFNWPDTQPVNTFYRQNLLLPAIPCIVRSQYEADFSILLIVTGILALLLLLLIYRTIALRKKEVITSVLNGANNVAAASNQMSS
ncbi:MAG TPA: hypothetical protein PLJ52_07870, partial [Tenuifilaceae bacterium]|nr:hypothetical protein [Tenuifilaceae bacterium]